MSESFASTYLADRAAEVDCNVNIGKSSFFFSFAADWECSFF